MANHPNRNKAYEVESTVGGVCSVDECATRKEADARIQQIAKQRRDFPAHIILRRGGKLIKSFTV